VAYMYVSISMLISIISIRDVNRVPGHWDLEKLPETGFQTT